jgi:hypothetical protein
MENIMRKKNIEELQAELALESEALATLQIIYAEKVKQVRTNTALPPDIQARFLSEWETFYQQRVASIFKKEYQRPGTVLHETESSPVTPAVQTPVAPAIHSPAPAFTPPSKPTVAASPMPPVTAMPPAPPANLAPPPPPIPSVGHQFHQLVLVRKQQTAMIFWELILIAG